MQEIKDSFDRRFSYLRLSVTDVCNFKCSYCLPCGYQKPIEQRAPLSLCEIKNLAHALSEVGVSKIRLTGGEPLTRQDLPEIVRTLKEVPGINKIAVSTNGYRLLSVIDELKNNGVSALNISLDSLDPQRFEEITGKKYYKQVLSGIERALTLGFDSIKVNVVLLKGLNDQDLGLWSEWVKNKKISVRFIELMQTGDNFDYYKKRHVSTGELKLKLLSCGWKILERRKDDGPAVEFSHPDFFGRIGIIAPYSQDFCKTCNRLRVTSQGDLRLCLFGEKNYSLRSFLQSPSQKEELKNQIFDLFYQKPVSHFLSKGIYGNTYSLSTIGG